jgi:hypothetical protein
MEKLSKLIGNLILTLYLRPRVKIINELNLVLENEVKGNKNKMLLFLISIIICTLILPLMIVYPEYPLIDKLKWSSYYLLFFSAVVLIISAYYEALLKFKEINTNDLFPKITRTLQSFEFKKDINYNNLSKNLLLKDAFTCDIRDLIKILSNEFPSNKVAITYVGANGRLSYHNLFFTFHCVLKNGIADLTRTQRKELLIFLTYCFKKNNQSIDLKTLNQNYNDWLKQKYHKSYENEFFEEFIDSKQSVKD